MKIVKEGNELVEATADLRRAINTASVTHQTERFDKGYDGLFETVLVLAQTLGMFIGVHCNKSGQDSQQIVDDLILPTMRYAYDETMERYRDPEVAADLAVESARFHSGTMSAKEFAASYMKKKDL
jgi:hypothetical protein